MMNINCSIVKDLLPLYIDNITSEESKKMIEDHLQECKECKRISNIMKEETEVSSIDEKRAMKNFLKQIKKKRLIAILLSIIVTIFLIILIWSIFIKRDFLIEYKENLITMEKQENGEIFLDVNTLNYTTCLLTSERNNNDTVDIYITLYQSLIDKFFLKNKQITYFSKCYKNYIKEDIAVNLIEEENKTKILLNCNSDIQITNIYYLEEQDEFITINNSEGKLKSSLKIKKIM